MPSTLDFTDALGYELDDLAVYTASGGAANTVILPALVNAGTSPSVTRFQSSYVYNRDGNRQHKVRTNGYTPGSGTLTGDPAWTVPTNGQNFGISRLFPFRDGLDAHASYLGLANAALKLIDIKDRIAVPIVPDQDAYDLTAVSATIASWIRDDRLGWQTERDGLVKVLEPHPVSGRQPIPADRSHGPSLRPDGGSVYLDLDAPFVAGTTGSITVNLLRPAFYWIGVNGAAFGESALGLSNATDLAVPSIADMLAVMKWLALWALMARGTLTSSGRWTQQDLQNAERAARAVEGFNQRSAQAVAAAPVAPGVAA